MDKNAVAINVATKLIEAERSIDAAMIDAAQMIESILQARAELGVNIASGDVAVARATDAMAALAEARRAAGATHAALAHAHRELGFDERATGITVEKNSARQDSGLRAAS